MKLQNTFYNQKTALSLFLCIKHYLKNPLYTTISDNTDTNTVKEKINTNNPHCIILKSEKSSLNVKAYRISQELTKDGWKITNIKQQAKKKPAENNTIKITLTNHTP